MTDSGRKLLASWLTTVLVLSVMVPTVGFSMTGVAAAANTLASGSVSVSGNVEVDANYNVFSTTGSGDAEIQVAYDAGGRSDSDFQFLVFNKDSGSTLSGVTATYSGSSGTATLSIPDSELTSDFNASVELMDTSGMSWTTLDRDFAEFYVRDTSSPPTVDIAPDDMRPYTNQSVAVGFDSDGVPKDDLELRLYNESSGQRLNTVDPSGSSDTGGTLVPMRAGGAGSGSFDARIELWDTSGTPTEIAGETATVTVGIPSVTLVDQSHSNGTVRVRYDTTGTSSTRYDLFLFTSDGNNWQQFDVSAGDNAVSVSTPTASGQESTQAVLVSSDGFLASDNACLYGASNTCPSISSASIEYADGTSPSGVTLDVDSGLAGMTEINLVESGNADNRNLSTVSGIDTSRDLWLNFSLDNANAAVLMGNADVKEWHSPTVDGAAEVQIRVSPAQVFRNQTIRTRDPNRWPATNGAATVKRTQVRLTVFDPPFSGLDGAFLASDAQAFRPPQFDGATSTLRLPAAGPHFETDGTTQNTGFYTAYIPSAMISQMGIANPTGLAVGGLGTGGSITEQDGGALIQASVHYSSGNVDISPDTTDPTADASNTGGTATEGSSFTLDGSASSDNSAIETYEWDVDDDNTYEKSTTSATTGHTFSSTGDETVTLRVTDGNGNTDTHEITVTVEAASSSDDGGSVSQDPEDRDGEPNYQFGSETTAAVTPQPTATPRPTVAPTTVRPTATPAPTTAERTAEPEPSTPRSTAESTPTPSATDAGTESGQQATAQATATQQAATTQQSRQRTDGAAGTTTGAGPGFGAVVALLALLSAGLLVARRRE